MLRPTHDNLREIAAPLLARWLIEAAKSRSDLTYGEAMSRLEREHSFTPIGRATNLGLPAGALMDTIHRVEPQAPLLNSILVLQADRMPSFGAGPFMAKRFGVPQLNDWNSRKTKRWREVFEHAATEVYEYKDWERLYERAFGERYRPTSSSLAPGNPRNKQERDGIPMGRRGEGPNHKSLRLWVQANPRKVVPSLGQCRADTEVDLHSGDRADVVYYSSKRTVCVEVKSTDSGDADLHRGIYQCVKYRAVMQAMDPRADAAVEVLFVTERPLPGYLASLATQLSIPHKDVSGLRGKR